MLERPSLKTRASGVLLHFTSLPGPHGIGDFSGAFDFVDFLAAAKQTWWQVFPLGPLGMGHSPYQVLSAFAGNSLLISLKKLRDDGLLDAGDVKPLPKHASTSVHYDDVARHKEKLFTKAYVRFVAENRDESAEFKDFCGRNDFWLSDYALFRALKTHHQERSWVDWEMEVRNRKDFALEQARDMLAESILYHKFLQFHFYTQLADVKRHCDSKGVGMIGDIPIFVAHDSADVWAHPEQFWLDSDGKPTVVAGVPPDYFSATGQLWGNPHYRWAVMRERGYDWWVNRFRAAFQIFDAIRLDHFIGFQKYWEIAAGSDTAQNGRWVEGPGADFFTKVFSDLPNAEFIAEDLGVVTPEVEALRDQFHLPGMRVLQFAFNGGDIHLPHNYVKNCVAYTGTHDNNTLKGWFLHDETKEGRNKILNYCQSSGKQIHWDLIRLAQMSVANTAIVPVQDLLGLDASARMNTPGTNSHNWAWRLPAKVLTPAIAKRLADLAETFARAR